MALSSVTWNWVARHDTAANFFPEFAGSVVYLSDIFLWVGLAFWTAGWYVSRPASWNWGPWFAAWPLVLLTGLSVLSVFWAEHSGQATYTAGRRVWLIALYLVFANERARSLRPALLALFLVGLLQAAVALGQVVTGRALGVWFAGEITQGALGYEGIGSPRAYGLGFNPNPVGLFLAVASTFMFGFFLTARITWPIRTLALASFVLTYMALRATDSRAAFLGWILGVLAVSTLTWLASRSERWRTIKRIGVAAVFVVLGEFFILTAPAQKTTDMLTTLPSPGTASVATRLSPEQISAGLSGRIADANQAVPIVRENLLIGVGAGNYALALRKRLAPDSVGVGYVPVHNVPLLLTAELGIVGGIAWMMIMSAPLLWVFTNLRRSARFEFPSLLWLGPLLVLLFVSLWEFTPWSTQDGRVLMMGVLGLWAGSVSRTPIAAWPVETKDWSGGAIADRRSSSHIP
jgi:O-antigen ligase